MTPAARPRRQPAQTPVRVWPPRVFWGIAFSGASDVEPSMIGSTWHRGWSQQDNAEPSRPMLFRSRKAAREWCADRHAEYSQRQDSLRFWRFRPIKVRESWECVS